jgi:predicted permease
VNWLHEFMARIAGLFGKQRNEAELTSELRAHLEMASEENIRRGMSPNEARYAARKEFGGVEQVKEIYRERRGLPMIETLLQDIRFGLRMLRKNPGFTAVAVLTLALGIGATTSIFSVVDSILLRPLPFRDPSRIMVLYERLPKLVPQGIPVSGPDVAHFRELNHAFEDLGAYSTNKMDISGTGTPQRIDVTRISAAVFRELGVQPVIGRAFRDDEDADGHHLAILGYALWQSRFAGDRDIVGKAISLDREPYTVVGVMPRTFEFPPQGAPFHDPGQLWIPVQFTKAELMDVADNYDFMVVAKTKPGVSVESANADANLVSRQIQRQFYPPGFSAHSDLDAIVKPLQEVVVGNSKNLLLLLLGAVGVLLLIACANVANLLLARGAERKKEISVRVALGARRGRLVRQLIVESTLLGIIGGILGFAAAYASEKLFLTLASAVLPRAQEVHMNLRVLWFALAISILSGVIFGTVPALAATKTDLNETLKESARTGAGAGQRRIRSVFVVVQLALAMLLVVASGLLIRSFAKVRTTNPGFRPSNVVAMNLALAPAQYPQASQSDAFYNRLLAATTALPGVSSASYSSDLPLNSGWTHMFSIEGRTATDQGRAPLDAHTLVGPGYLETMGIPLIRGRFFTDSELHGASNVLLISEGMAKKYWSGDDAVGKRIKWGVPESNSPWMTIVGVVGDVKDRAIDEATREHTYEPFTSSCDASDNPFCASRYLLARTENNPSAIGASLRSAVHQIDPEQAMGVVRLLDDVVDESLAPRKFNLLMLTVFGGGALLLAAIGIYGVLAYNVTRQLRELGVRMALGANPSDVLWLVLRNGLALALIGLAIGIGCALGLTRVMKSLLFEVSATDPATFAGVAIIFIAVTLAACWIPARRAMHVDPAAILRHE